MKKGNINNKILVNVLKDCLPARLKVRHINNIIIEEVTDIKVVGEQIHVSIVCSFDMSDEGGLTADVVLYLDALDPNSPEDYGILELDY